MRNPPLKRKPKKAPTAAEKRYWDSLPGRCEACLTSQNLVIHHILQYVSGKQGRRDNMTVVRLCATCHNMGKYSVHGLGSEVLFFRETGVNLPAIALERRVAWEKAHPIVAPDRGVP